MNISYIANVRIPTEKAHGIQIVKMCEAFIQNGHHVELIIPDRQHSNTLKIKNLFAYYQLRSKFPITLTTHLDAYRLNFLGFNHTIVAYYLQNLSFCLKAKKHVKPTDLIYTRSLLFTFLADSNLPLIYEAHDPASINPFNRIVARKVRYVVCITKSIQNSWNNLGADTIYSPDGVGEEFFTSVTKSQARQQLNLPNDQKIILYTGSYHPWKGTQTLLDSSKIPSNLHFYFIGSQAPQIDQSNLHIFGHQPYAQISLWLKAADVLVIPNSAKYKKGKIDTSPLKLFEYMASGTPIIASKVPAIEEIVSNQEVTFFRPDDPIDLATKIKHVFANYPHTKQKARQAKTLAKKFTWSKRAEKIIHEIHNET